MHTPPALAGTLWLTSLLISSCAPSIHTIPWEPLGVPEGEHISALITNPQDPSLIYCGSATGDFSVSTNHGRTWITKGSIPGQPRIHGLLLHPDSDQRVYVASDGGLYHSVDAGLTFQSVAVVTARTTQPGCFSVAFDPWQPANLFAGFKEHGIYESSDGGRTWANRNGDLDPDEVSSGIVEEIVVHPLRPGLLFAILSTAGAIRSTDGGTTWTKITERFDASGTVIKRLIVSPNNPDLLYIGTGGGDIYRSENSGTTWELSLQGTGYSPVANFARGHEGTVIYAGTAGGVMKSENFDGTWTSAGSQFPRLLSSVVAVQDSQATGFYLFGPGTGIRFLPGNKTVWARADSGLVGPTTFSSIILSNDGKRVLATTGTSVFCHDGSSWQSLSEGLPGTSVTAIATDRSSDSLLYSSTTSGPYHSENQGRTWRPLGKNMAGTSFHSIVAHPAIGSRLMGMTESGLMVSTDKGMSWNRSKPPLRGHEIRSMTFHPANAGIVLAGSANHGALLSQDGGISWDESKYGLEGNEIVATTFPGDNQSIYHCWGSDGKGYRSTNKGLEWTVIPQPWENIEHFLIVHDESIPSSLIALVNRSELYYSANAGTEWIRLPVVPPPAPIVTLAWNATTHLLYAGSIGDGLFRIPLKKEIDKALKK